MSESIELIDAELWQLRQELESLDRGADSENNRRYREDVIKRIDGLQSDRDSLMPNYDDGELHSLRHRIHILEERVTELAVAVGIITNTATGHRQLTTGGIGTIAFAIMFAVLVTVFIIFASGNS